MAYSLYPHQKELVDKARIEISKGNKHILIQSPAGSGKSIVIADIVKSATEKGNHVLFIVHRQELVNQIKQTFEKNNINPLKTTVMTVGKVANRLGKIPRPDMIVTDESHHSRASTYRKIYDYYPEAYRLGFTATPWRLSGKGFTDIYDVMVTGKQVQWLIDHNYLADYKMYSVDLSDHDKLKKNSNADYTKKSIDKALGKTIFGDVVENYQRFAPNKKTILYAHSIEYSQHFADRFNEQGIPAAHCDSKTPKKERDQIMADFKSGETQVLCNVDLISEGFNVPDCSCVIMARPTASLVLYIQQSMRCMRYQPNKEAVIIDHVGNHAQHGTPRMDREWSLEDRSKKKKTNTISELPTKECPGCFGVIHAVSRECPLCGHIIPVESSEVEQTDDKLELIDDGLTVDYKKINAKKQINDKYRKADKEELETLEDYYLFTKANGIKENWIKFQKPELRAVSWPQFHGMLRPIKQKYQEIYQ